MTLQLELWHIITLLITLISAFFGLLKILMSQQMSQIKEGFAANTKRLDKIEDASKEESNNWQRVEREILLLKADLPVNYVRREDYVQAIATIMAKLDAMSMRFENILLKGQQKS